MSKWCNTCSRNKITGEWQSCSSDCPAFGKYLEELAEMVIKQQAEIDALRWTNKHLIKTEKEKRKELWKKAITEFADRLIDRADLIRTNAFDSKWAISQDDIDNLVEEMTSHIKE